MELGTSATGYYFSRRSGLLLSSSPYNPQSSEDVNSLSWDDGPTRQHLQMLSPPRCCSIFFCQLLFLCTVALMLSCKSIFLARWLFGPFRRATVWHLSSSLGGITAWPLAFGQAENWNYLHALKIPLFFGFLFDACYSSTFFTFMAYSPLKTKAAGRPSYVNTAWSISSENYLLPEKHLDYIQLSKSAAASGFHILEEIQKGKLYFEKKKCPCSPQLQREIDFSLGFYSATACLLI